MIRGSNLTNTWLNVCKPGREWRNAWSKCSRDWLSIWIFHSVICLKGLSCTRLRGKLLSAILPSNRLLSSRRYMGWIMALRQVIVCAKWNHSSRRNITMRFSLFSVLDFYEDGSRTLSALYAQLLDQIVEADRLGFAAFWIGEHHGYLTPHLALSCPNPAIVLAAAAQHTQRIGLNTAIANLSLRHPLLLAEDYALVDLLSH